MIPLGERTNGDLLAAVTLLEPADEAAVEHVHVVLDDDHVRRLLAERDDLDFGMAVDEDVVAVLEEDTHSGAAPRSKLVAFAQKQARSNVETLLPFVEQGRTIFANIRRSVLYLMTCKQITRNRFVWGALVICLVLLAVALYVPVIAGILSLEPPSPRGWQLVAVGSVAPLIAGQAIILLTDLAHNLLADFRTQALADSRFANPTGNEQDRRLL